MSYGSGMEHWNTFVLSEATWTFFWGKPQLMPTESAVTYQFSCSFGFHLIQKYSFYLLKSLPLTCMHFLGKARFIHGSSKFQIHQHVSTKHKHSLSAVSHKLTVRSSRLLVTPDTSNTSSPSTGWQRADAILREILIFFLTWLSIERGVSHELGPTKASGYRFTLCHWDSIYTLVYVYELNGYHNLKMKNICTVTSQNSHTCALWCDITHLDNGKALEENSSL